jgi:hypothetical protein
MLTLHKSAPMQRIAAAMVLASEHTSAKQDTRILIFSLLYQPFQQQCGAACCELWVLPAVVKFNVLNQFASPAPSYSCVRVSEACTGWVDHGCAVMLDYQCIRTA